MIIAKMSAIINGIRRNVKPYRTRVDARSPLEYSWLVTKCRWFDVSQNHLKFINFNAEGRRVSLK